MTASESANADFAEVFAREDRDRGADTAAPATRETVRDDQGRFAQKEAPQQEASPPPAPEVASEQQEPQHGRQVPLSELLGEREKRQSERKLREEAEKRATEYEARTKAYEQMLANLQKPQTQQQPQEPPPDFFTDPDAAFNARMQPLELRAENARLDMSEMLARDKFGDAAVDAALQVALQTGANRQFLNPKIKHPYAELVKWHESTKVYQEIGPDPKQYRDKLETEIRAKVLAELKAGGTQPQPKFPGSLADATQAGTQGAHVNIEAEAASIFSSQRDRRRG